MEIGRRVQVRCYAPKTNEKTAAARFGSGYLIGPRLVLTAGHVVGDTSGPASGRITVTRPDAGPAAHAATVLWHRYDEQADSALVAVDDGHDWQPPDSLAEVLTRPAQRWGRLIGARPHPVTVFGFPRMQKDHDDGSRYDEQLTGHLLPGTGSLAGRYEILGTDPQAPAALPPGSSATGWSGMSGAALLAEALGGALLCGVVRADRGATGGTRLTATPAHVLLADPGFITLVEQHTGWEPLAEPAEPAGLLAPAAPRHDLHSPAMLLRADAEAVTFDAESRRQDIAQLHAWCSAEQRFSVRVLTGPGGHGKTRLARHLTDTLHRHGWTTGHLRSELTDTDPLDLAPLETTDDLLLVVDYAETRPHLVRRLVAHLSASRHRARLLLIARADGAWRTDAVRGEASVRELLGTADVVELAPLIPRGAAPAARAGAFARAAADLAALLDRHPHIASRPDGGWPDLAAALTPAADLDHERYDSVLTLQMTALTELLQRGPAPVATSPGQPVEETLLSHERRYWEDTARAPAFRLERLSTPVLETAVAVAALCGAATAAEADNAVAAVPGLPDEKAADADRWLQALYPPSPGDHWGSLQPDRLAEYHASRTLNADTLALLLSPTTASPAQQTRIVTVLTRAAIAHHDAHRTTDADRTLTALDTALDKAPLDLRALENVVAALLYHSDVLAPLALRLAHDLTTALRRLPFRQRRARRPDLAFWLSELGSWLATAGQQDEAVKAKQEAVRIYRKLAAGDDTFTSRLADSLSSLGSGLAAADRLKEAAKAEQEAVRIYRKLTILNDAFVPSLADSLSSLGNLFAIAGRRRKAVKAEQEAVMVYWWLAGVDDTFTVRLADSLSSLGSGLAAAGRLKEAVKTEQEAVRINRELAAENDIFTLDLADSLSSLGSGLAAAGRREEALTAAEEAVGMYRRLAAERPADFTERLSFALGVLADALDGLGRSAEAEQIRHQVTDELEQP
ncbi:tetratricopeptide repeat protein [Streptomyces coeruleorubidus]|uniref:tetratricopeptide repeat protein n=1 Tax=Streptomyces coeruleorubidus TaxID=116188 RepID=UPI003407C442